MHFSAMRYAFCRSMRLFSNSVFYAGSRTRLLSPTVSEHHMRSGSESVPR